MKEHHSHLDNIFTPSEPLGPNQHDRIKDKYAEELTYHKISLFSDLKDKPPMLLIGRKGAGKTAIISEILLELKRKEHRRERRDSYANTQSHDNLYGRGSNYIIGVRSWERFLQIVRNVNSQFGPGEILDEQIPSEYFIEIWYEMLWDEIFQYFYNFAHEDDFREQLRPIYDYFNVGDAYFTGSVRHQADRIFNAAILSILELLETRKSKLYFLFDSLDSYPIRNPIFFRTLVGLFQGLTKVSDHSSRIIITFCIPEEIEGYLTSVSSNLLKDFASSLRIKWKPSDLMRIVAHRIRISARENDEKLYSEIKNLDLNERDDLHRLFTLVLPPTILNSLGTEEDTLAYMIRHTQLLPRHILQVFNSVLSIHYKVNKTFINVSPDAIRAGVESAQKLIAGNILTLYERAYPKLLNQCKKILPDLDPICDYKKLRRMQNRFDRLIEDDVDSVWRVLFEIGILGRSTGMNGIENHDVVVSERYCYGQFYFNIDGSFGFASDGEYCFHPVFSRHFGMNRRTADKRVVYPAKIDLHKLYD